MRGVTLLALTLSALLLGALLWWSAPGDRSVADEAVGRRLLPTLDPDAVTTVTLSCAVTLTRVQGMWQVALSPRRRVRARQAALRRLLAELRHAAVRRTVDPRVRAEEVNLAPPRLWVTARTADGRSWRVNLGRFDPTGRGVYARVAGSAKLVVADATLYRAADRSPATLRDPNLVPGGPADLRRVTVARTSRPPEGDRSGPARFTLNRAGAIWTVEMAGVTSAADPLTTGRLVSALAGLTARRFDVDADDFVPLLDVDLTLRGGGLSLTVGDVCPGTPGQRAVRVNTTPPTVVCVDVDDVRPLETRPASLRDRALVRLSEPYLAAISLDGPAGEIELVRRDDGDWVRAGDEPVDQVAVRRWVERLAGIRSVGSFSRWSDPPDRPAARLRWRTEAGERSALVVGQPEGEVVRAWRKADNAVLPVGRHVLDLLAEGATLDVTSR